MLCAMRLDERFATLCMPPAVQPSADAAFCGVLLGYVAYDCMHYLMHRCALCLAAGMRLLSSCSELAAAATAMPLLPVPWPCCCYDGGMPGSCGTAVLGASAC